MTTLILGEVVSGTVIKHYSRDDVKAEVAEFCRGRWVAIEGSVGEKRVFLRYSGRKPLIIESPAQVPILIRRYGGLRARTFYATANVYRDLSSTAALDDLSNIAATTPFWDIDTELSKWDYAIKAAQLICDFLESEGVSKSVYVLWSGEGAHVRISEHAFSEELLSKHHPLDIAFAVTEYVLRKLKDKLEALHKESGGVLKVENLVDVKRVFTAPLSLHRKHDLVAVCMRPDDLTSFDISWAKVGEFKHRTAWREYEVGEADELAVKALAVVGKVKTKPVGTKSTRVGKVVGRTAPKKVAAGGGKLGRFQVMALLQAARYYILTGDLEKAKSFGLNRAIFYAWAKHYGRFYVGRRAAYRYAGSGREVPESERKLVSAAGEEAFVSPRGWFVMGGQEQLPEDYDRNVVSKVESAVPYEVAWEAALKYLSRFPKQVLQDPQKFYEKAYKPVRDEFIEKVIEELIELKEEVMEGRVEPQVKSSTLRSKGEYVRKTKTLLDWVKKEGKEGKTR